MIPNRVERHLRWTLPLLLLILLALPAAALEDIYLVRHAEKLDVWPPDRDLDAFQPLSPKGETRAEALSARLKSAGIAAIYTSRTTRTLETGVPLAHAASVPIIADDASIRPEEMSAFLARLRQKHEKGRAVLIVGH